MQSFYSMQTDEVRLQINGKQTPLSNEEIKQHQEKFGKNELQEEKRKNGFRLFFEQFLDFLVIILIIAAIISLILGNIESAIVILIVITVNAILGTVQTIKAENSINSLKQLSSPVAKVLRNGKIVIIPSNEITVGDEVYIEAGDAICADGRLLNCTSLKIDESMLTGESLNSEKNTHIIKAEVPLGDRYNMVFSGSLVTYGKGSFLVTSIGMNTEIGKIALLLKNTSERKTPLQINLDKFGKKLSILILIFCGILFAINILKGGNIADAFLFAIALAVAAIPEALSSIVTIVLSFGTQKMAKECAIIKKLQAVEGLGCVSVICSDKTGTLTQNKMTVTNYFTDFTEYQIENISNKTENLSFNQRALIVSSILCNDAFVDSNSEVGDPTETALLKAAISKNFSIDDIRKQYPTISSLPFDSDRKLMSSLHNINGKFIMITKGAIDVMLAHSTSVLQDGKIIPLDKNILEQILHQNDVFSKQGLRVLCYGFKELSIQTDLSINDEKDFIFLGLSAMIDPPRKESFNAVKECLQAGIKPIMITGDHKITAAVIAKSIGILTNDDEVCEGCEIEKMTDTELDEFVEKICVYARVSPEHKIRIVQSWQRKGFVVAMTGDGVNDAPALKQADVGVAMGITGTEVAKSAAAMILTDDNFSSIVKAVENGRNVYANIKKSILFLLSGNFAAILAVLYASIAALPVPFAPVHLLFINLLTDSLPAIALGLENHTSSVMNEKPRSLNENILNKSFLLRMTFEGLVISVFTMIAFYIGYLKNGQLLGSTMAFATLCMARLFHGYNCKSVKPTLFTKSFFSNKMLQLAFFVGLVLLTTVLCVPVLQSAFCVITLSIKELLIIYGLSFSSLLVIQFAKLILMLKRSTPRN